MGKNSTFQFILICKKVFLKIVNTKKPNALRTREYSKEPRMKIYFLSITEPQSS